MSLKKKRIMIISPFASPNIGGVESHLDKLIRKATENDFYVILITYQPLTTKTQWKKKDSDRNFEIHRARWYGVGLFTKIENYFPVVFFYLFPGLFIKSLTYYIKHHKSIHCIHAHGLAAATIARLLKLFKKKRIILSTHAIYRFAHRPTLSWIVKKILNEFDYIMGVSEVSKDEIVKMGLPKERVGVHKNWVDTSIFSAIPIEQARERVGIGNEINLLFVGRFLEIKGVGILCDVARNLKDIQFHFVGTGPLLEKVQKAAEELDNVTYYGVLKQDNPKEKEKLTDLYNACDYFVSPYTYDEGFSATLVESVCCGTPVIVTNRGSPPTFLDNTVALFLSEDPTKEELIEFLGNLKRKTEKEQNICRNFALSNLGESNADFILEQYL